MCNGGQESASPRSRRLPTVHRNADVDGNLRCVLATMCPVLTGTRTANLCSPFTVCCLYAITPVAIPARKNLPYSVERNFQAFLPLRHRVCLCGLGPRGRKPLTQQDWSSQDASGRRAAPGGSRLYVMGKSPESVPALVSLSSRRAASVL